jgi:hypothetical protein
MLINGISLHLINNKAHSPELQLTSIVCYFAHGELKNVTWQTPSVLVSKFDVVLASPSSCAIFTLARVLYTFRIAHFTPSRGTGRLQLKFRPIQYIPVYMKCARWRLDGTKSCHGIKLKNEGIYSVPSDIFQFHVPKLANTENGVQFYGPFTELHWMYSIHCIAWYVTF